MIRFFLGHNGNHQDRQEGFCIPPPPHYQVTMKTNFRTNPNTCATLISKQAQKGYINLKSLSTFRCYDHSLFGNIIKANTTVF